MFLSPTLTPPRSANVEKLLSLQKSTRHISDADILSVAAEASAMKRQQARDAYNLENVQPNTRALPKRLFDISECSKSAAGYYESPQKPTAQEFTNAANEDCASDSDADSDTDEETEQDTREQAEKHYSQILQIVNNKMAEVSRRNALTSPPVKNVMQTNKLNQHGCIVNHDNFLSYEAPAETECSVKSFIETATNHEFPTEIDMGVDAIKSQVMHYILSVINTGAYDEILALRGIGKVRALRIFTERNTGHTFTTLGDFADCVDMNEKTLVKFIQANAADIML